jgi:hypothetical protein
MAQKIKTLSFEEVIKKAKEKAKEVQKYYDETGLCFSCKKEKPILTTQPKLKETFPKISNPYLCQKCNEETEKILEEMRKDSGFMEL